jgi:hypothetical protein
MKKSISLLTLGLLFAGTMVPSDAWNSKVITITSGTAIRVVNNSVKASSILFQMLDGGSGLGYVLNANPQNANCNKASAGTAWVAELAPATVTAPGGSATVPSNGSATTEQGGQDLQWFCVDGAHSGDTVLVSWNPR